MHEEIKELKFDSGLNRRLTDKEKRFIKMLDSELLIKMKKGKGFDKTQPIFENGMQVFYPGDKI